MRRRIKSRSVFWVSVVGLAQVFFLSTSGYGTPAWPSDFNEKVHARLTAIEANAAGVSATAASYEPYAEGTAVEAELGTEADPFDSRTMTRETAISSQVISTDLPRGLFLVIR
jgi:hypothetical protein